MKIPLRYDVARVASTDVHKYALDHIRVEKRGDSHVAIASNGREYVMVPVEMGPDDKPGNYPAAAFREARELAVRELKGALDDRADFEHNAVPTLELAIRSGREQSALDLRGDGEAVIHDGILRRITIGSAEHDKPFPALPKKFTPSGEPIARFTLDARRLLNMALALGSTGAFDMVPVTVEVHDADPGIPLVIRPACTLLESEPDGAVGYLMRISSESEEVVAAAAKAARRGAS